MEMGQTSPPLLDIVPAYWIYCKKNQSGEIHFEPFTDKGFTIYGGCLLKF